MEKIYASRWRASACSTDRGSTGGAGAGWHRDLVRAFVASMVRFEEDGSVMVTLVGNHVIVSELRYLHVLDTHT